VEYNFAMERTNDGSKIKVRCKATGGQVANVAYSNFTLGAIQSSGLAINANCDCKHNKETEEMDGEMNVAPKLPGGWQTFQRGAWETANYTLHRAHGGVAFFSLEDALTYAATANCTLHRAPCRVLFTTRKEAAAAAAAAAPAAASRTPFFISCISHENIHENIQDVP
jgi:hypothetical protein